MPSTKKQPLLENRWVMAGVALAVAGSFAFFGTAFSARQQEVNRLRDLSDRLQEARVVADSCTRSLTQDEVEFRRFNEVIDSLKGEVDEFEGMDSEGVPEALYDEYLSTFELYNSEVARWEEVTASLRANEASCRTLVEMHNSLNDSLRSEMSAAGLTREPSDGRSGSG